MANFRIFYGPDSEWADDYDEARDIAFCWSVDEHGANINIEDQRTGELTQVWA